MEGVPRGPVRRAILAVTRLVFVAGAIWAGYLSVAGGVDLRVFGHAVSSHEPMRPVLVVAMALAVFIMGGGDEAFVAWIERLAEAGARFRRFDSIAIGVLVSVVLVVGITHASRLADGSDAFGYVSEADLFLGRDLALHQPWATDVPWPNGQWSFAPLAYRPGPAAAAFSLAGYRPTFDATALVPTYSPGLPMLMAAAKWIAGPCAVFYVVPLAGAVLVLATFGLGSRVGSRRLGTIAAFLVATSPTAVRHALVAMSDVPVAAAWTVAWWAALGRSSWSAMGAGSALALMVLIRPNLVPLGVLIVVWAASRVVRDPAHRRRHAGRAIAIAGGLAAGMLVTAAVYWWAYGSPTQSGYAGVSSLFGVSHILPNLRNYPQWFLQDNGIVACLGVAALFIPVKRLWPGVPDDLVVPAFAAALVVLLAEFCYFSVFDNASYLRFFLPAYPLIMIGLASVSLLVARIGRLSSVGVAAAVIMCGLLGVRAASDVRAAWQRDAATLDLMARVRLVTDDRSVVIAMQHSGGVRYHAGRVTLRYDYLEPDWLDRAVAWMADRGVHTYAVLQAWEVPIVQQRFAGQALEAAFERPPAISIGNERFFDLGRTPPAAPEIITESPTLNRCLPAAPLPILVWKR